MWYWHNTGQYILSHIEQHITKFRIVFLNDTSVDGVDGQNLSWTQRISAAIGVAKGIQFLHGGIIPGLFANNLKITNVLLDQNLGSKIRSYNLPMLSENTKAEVKIKNERFPAHHIHSCAPLENEKSLTQCSKFQ